MLCPTGRATSEQSWERRAGRGGKFPKQAFQYVAERDVYRCPSGREPIYKERKVDTFGRHYRLYRGTRCADCQLRQRCTESKHGRPLKRYEGEELKEAMNQVLSQPAARAKYQRRGRSSNPALPSCASGRAQALSSARTKGSASRIRSAWHRLQPEEGGNSLPNLEAEQKNVGGVWSGVKNPRREAATICGGSPGLFSLADDAVRASQPMSEIG